MVDGSHTRIRVTLWLVAIFAVAASGAPLRAHDTWLLPQHFQVGSGEEIECALTSGMEFPKNDHAVAADRIDTARLRFAGAVKQLTDLRPEADHLAIRARLDGAGIAGFALSSKPREITQSAAEVSGYFDEIGAPDSVRSAWAASGRSELRELCGKNATSFVRVGDSEGDVSFREPLGLDFEMVAEVDPTRLEAGARFLFVAWFRGAPLAGVSVSLAGAGGKAVATVITDAAGRGAVEIPASGPWLLRSVYLRSPTGAAEPWESDFTTLSFEAEPPPGTTGALAVAERFAAALRSGDGAGALACLAPDVAIFEHGSAELSRDEYASEHLGGDIEYLRATESKLVDRRVLDGGNRVVVLTRSETRGAFRGKPVASSGTETLVLERRGSDWLIVHIHWSSHKL
jgi:ketosteroid isomerase-like protein/uncharacterized GH25 family protein